MRSVGPPLFGGGIDRNEAQHIGTIDPDLFRATAARGAAGTPAGRRAAAQRLCDSADVGAVERGTDGALAGRMLHGCPVQKSSKDVRMGGNRAGSDRDGS